MKYSLGLLVLTLSLTGCSNPQEASNSNFSKAIQAFLSSREQALCLPLAKQQTPFVLVNSSSDKRQTDILVELGLLKSKKTQVEVSQLFGTTNKEGTEYDLTSDGKKYLVELSSQRIGFCTGTYKVSTIENFTTPTAYNGITVSQVNFTYKLDNLAKWAKNPAVLNFDGKLKQLLETNERQGKATLFQTNNGWVHEHIFRK